MSTAYGDQTDLRAMLAELGEVRSRLAAVPDRKFPSAQEYWAALRRRSPELPEKPQRLAADSPDDLPWPDNCGAWLGVAIDRYEAALSASDSFDVVGSVLHEIDGDYALTQATQCLKLGF